jgi:L-malate glycosyltransferase
MSQLLKMRILYFNHTGLVSGAERVLLNMLKVLDHCRYETCVLCPTEGGLADLVKRSGAACFAVPQIRARFSRRPGMLIRSGLSVIGATVSIRKRILQWNPDVVHANSIRAGVVATLSTIGTRRTVIWHVHDILPAHPMSTLIRLIAYLSPRTRIIGVSNAATKALCGPLRFKQRARTIHNGIDLDKFPRKQPGVSSFRRDLGVADDDFLICAVGQICARKGLLELLEAFKQVCATAPKARLIFVGKAVFPHEDEYGQSLLKLAESAEIWNRVQFAGELSDVAAALQAADLLVLNSRHEPFGLVLVEAMSCGTPVLATQVDGIPEIVTNNENGWLVNAGDTTALATRLIELAKNREARERVAEFAHRTTCPRFSLDRFRVALHEFYAELARTPQTQWDAHNQPALAGPGED